MKILAAAGTPSGMGAWLVTAEGDVVATGDAYFHGSPAELVVPIVSILASPTGRGYHLIDIDGGVHSFGDIRTPTPALLTSR